jgi:hypothetical protein
VAKKPPICISIVPIIIPSTSAINLHILWTSTDPGYPILHVDETITLVQAIPGGNEFIFGPIEKSANHLWYGYAQLPFVTPYNYVQIQAQDTDADDRVGDNFFEPDRAPPFDQVITSDWSTVPTIDTIIAHFFPA